MTPADQKLRESANQWFAAELEHARRGHGADWERNREWVEDYLRAELRERLAPLKGKA